MWNFNENVKMNFKVYLIIVVKKLLFFYWFNEHTFLFTDYHIILVFFYLCDEQIYYIGCKL